MCFQGWTGEASIADAIVEMAQRLPKCKMFITTRGTQGSILLERGALEQVSKGQWRRRDLVRISLEGVGSAATCVC